MPKNKPHKGLLKRVKITKTGKVLHKACGTGHLKSGKTSKRLRQLRKDTVISNSGAKAASRMLARRIRGRNKPRAAVAHSPAPCDAGPSSAS